MSLVLPLPLPPAPSPPMESHFPLSPPSSSSSTPTASASTSPAHDMRPSTPPPLLAAGIAGHLANMAPLSAPPTPVTPTHYIHPLAKGEQMERCHSSEARLTADTHTPSPVLSGRPATPDSGNPHPPTASASATATPSSDDQLRGRGRSGRAKEVKATSLLFKSVPSKEQIAATENTEDGQAVYASPDPQQQMQKEEDDRMDVDEPPRPEIWGMPKWGWEEERKEVRPGVRLVAVEELPVLIDQHAMLDTPSHVLFPWLHGISDDGAKGRDMAAFFGHAPPFAPPAYRGLTVLLAPPHPLDKAPVVKPSRSLRSQQPRLDVESRGSTPVARVSNLPVQSQPTPAPASKLAEPLDLPPTPRDRSETMSTSSESWTSSTGTTEGTSPSVADWQPPSPPSSTKPGGPPSSESVGADDAEGMDVAMHPCESKRVSIKAHAEGLDEVHHPLPCSSPEESETDSSSCGDDDDDEDQRPTCILLNALHVQDVFDLPKYNPRAHPSTRPKPRFRPARLPHQINLRNLNIQQIKYATISDIVLYAKNGVGHGVLHTAELIAQAQQELYDVRMEEYYRSHGSGVGEGFAEPVRYGVWVVVEPFAKLEQACPHLVNVDSIGNPTVHSSLTDLFEREAKESRLMTRGSEVIEGFWVGNDCDIPGGADDGAGATIPFDLCVKTSECSEMPTSTQLSMAYRKLLDLDRRRNAAEESSVSSWASSPATIALRNLLTPNASPSPSQSTADIGSKRNHSPVDETPARRRRSRTGPPMDEFVSLECSGSCRAANGLMRNTAVMVDKVVELVYFLRKIVEGRDKAGIKRKVLVHCQDGYTESSILVLSYIMAALSLSLPEAYLHLQNQAERSFFLYPSDKPLLRKIDARLAADRRAKAAKTPLSPLSPGAGNTPTNSPSSLAKWKSWSLGMAKDTSSPSPSPSKAAHGSSGDRDHHTAPEEEPLNSSAEQAKIWFDDRRFDGFPSRILPFLYLGNLEHAGNAAMLHALGISHVVSVGESLIGCAADCDPMYGQMGPNTLCNEARAGRISVLDLTDIRDDGNDPLRPLIARACEWIEAARLDGGKVLVHCRVGVSRSASIVMAYMMQHLRLGLMDAYLLTRARRLNVLIQPNLRFFHELFGWEVELARREEEAIRRGEMEIEERRRIYYSWPSFCRDLHCLNRRFLCN